MPHLRNRNLTIGATMAIGLLGLFGCAEPEQAPEPHPPATEATVAVGVTEPAPIVDRDPPKLSPVDVDTELLVDVIAEGTGPKVTAGQVVTVHYTGAVASTGEVFDSSWDRQPFSFVLGAGEVITGWDLGLEDANVGDRLQLAIPADYGYGDAGAPPAIAPNTALVFVVDVLAATSPS